MQSLLKKRIFSYRDRIKARTLELSTTTAHDSQDHWYVRDGEKYPSVSAKLKFIKDPSLSNFAVNQAIAYIRDHWKDIHEGNVSFHLDRAARASTDLMHAAGDIGTAAHEVREMWFQKWIDDGVLVGDMAIPEVGTVKSEVIAAARAMKRLIEETGYIPVATEIPLVDHDLKLGGCVDDIGFLPSRKYGAELVLMDVKTSNRGDKVAYYYQTALYYQMFVNLYGIRPKKIYIAHLSKNDDGYNLIPIPDIELLVKEARSVLTLAESYKRIEQSKIKQPIIYDPTRHSDPVR